MNPSGAFFANHDRALRCRARENDVEGLSWVKVHQFIQATRNVRQPQIIRLLAAAGLAVLTFVPGRAWAQVAPCVSCLVIGVDAASLESASLLAPGSLDGVQLLVTDVSRGDKIVESI